MAGNIELEKEVEKVDDYSMLREAIQKRINTDGYTDFCKKLGSSLDHIKFIPAIGNDLYFGQLFVGNGLFKKIVDCVARDMVRQWVDIPSDEDGKIMKYMQKKKLRQAFFKALQFDRLYGGALIYMVIDDGGTSTDPVKPDKIKDILKLKVYPRTRVSISIKNYYSDPLGEKFDEPEFFTINPYGGTSFDVHESRCITFTGELVPDEVDSYIQKDKFWGMSAMQPIFEKLANYGMSEEAILKLIIKSNYDVLKIKDLTKLLSTKQGKAGLKARVDLLDANKSVSTTLVLDALEEFTNNVASFSGVDGAMAKVQESVAAISEIPVTILFGTSAKGLNSTGDNEVRIYYDKIKFYQEEKVLDGVMRFIKYSAPVLKIADAEETCIEFLSLWQQTEKEKADVRKTMADADNIYISAGVLTANEVRESRFTGKYSLETQLQSEDPFNTEGADPEEMQQSGQTMQPNAKTMQQNGIAKKTK